MAKLCRKSVMYEQKSHGAGLSIREQAPASTDTLRWILGDFEGACDAMSGVRLLSCSALVFDDALVTVVTDNRMEFRRSRTIRPCRATGLVLLSESLGFAGYI